MRKRGELKIVLIEPQHLGQVDHLHDVQERVTKHPVDRPLLLKHPIAMALGVERDGKLIGGIYFEQILEGCVLGTSPEATDEIAANAEVIFDALRQMGFRWLRVFVPKGETKQAIGDKLERVGFNCPDGEFSHYAKDLRR